jgi:hypothetical protein
MRAYKGLEDFIMAKQMMNLKNPHASLKGARVWHQDGVDREALMTLLEKFELQQILDDLENWIEPFSGGKV